MLMALKLYSSVAGLPVAAQGSHAEEHSEGKGKGAADIPFSMLHKVWH